MYRFLSICMIVIVCLTGCVSQSVEPVLDSSFYQKYNGKLKNETQQVSNHLVIWTPENIFENSLPRFQEMYPDMEIIIETVDKEELVNKYLTSLIVGKTPDVFIFPDQYLGMFRGVGGLEELNESTYYEEEFFKKRPQALLDEHIYNDKMRTFPLLFFPYVTFYRADIFEENNYPHEPLELSKYINKATNWYKLAYGFYNHNQYIMESDHSLIEIALRTSNFLNDDVEYIVENSPFNETVKAAQLVTNKPYDQYVNIWEDSGKEALANDQLVMFYSPSYMKDNLEQWLPEQKGKWAITTLPFGLRGVDKDASLSAAISSSSNNKKAAWQFIKHMANDMLNMYTHPIQSDFYRNDDIQKIYRKMIDENNPGTPSPLDREIKWIWNHSIKEFQLGYEIKPLMIEQAHKDVMNFIRQDQQALQNLKSADE